MQANPNGRRLQERTQPRERERARERETACRLGGERESSPVCSCPPANATAHSVALRPSDASFHSPASDSPPCYLPLLPPLVVSPGLGGAMRRRPKLAHQPPPLFRFPLLALQAEPSRSARTHARGGRSRTHARSTQASGSRSSLQTGGDGDGGEGRCRCSLPGWGGLLLGSESVCLPLSHWRELHEQRLSLPLSQIGRAHV